MNRLTLLSSVVPLAALLALPAGAQSLANPLASPNKTGTLNASPTVSADVQFLFDLEAKFEQATIAGGGPGFASFFADDGVTIANKTDVRRGRVNIANAAKWSPADFQLTWTPQGGQMSPAGDMGFTWGHYTGHSKDKDGKPVTESGRYMTIWKRQSDGAWKVAMDASNEEPADCTCTDDVAVPKQ